MSDRVTQSIFSAIDAGNYKLARTLCLQQLQKYPNSSYYYALNSYVLLLNGERNEAIKNARKLLQKTPSDPNSLELLNIVFRKLGFYKESIDIYENACKKYPSLSLIQCWFDLSINNLDILSLQKASMLLVQHTPAKSSRDLKLCCSFNLLVASGMHKITKQQRFLFPKLGLKMIENLKPYNNAQELYIYVNLLLLNGKSEEAVSEITEFIKKEKDLELQIILLNTLCQLESWSQLYDISYKILSEDNLDDWNTWCHLIKSSQETGRLDQVIELATNCHVSRNSKLALLQIAGDRDEPSFRECLLSYITSFGDKLCCYPDLKPFASSARKETFMLVLNDQFQQRCIDDGLTNEKLTIKQTTFLVNYIKFKAFLIPEFLDTFECTKNLLKFHAASKHLLKNKEKTDLFIGNEFILLILNSLLRSAASAKDKTQEILKCIVILERAVTTDVHEFHLRLWLVRLYSILNCYTKAKAHFTTLKVRFIQNDTLSPYLLSNVGLLHPTASSVKDIDNALNVYSNNQRETTYILGEAYEKKSFNKIKGFFDFALRVENSLTRFLNLLEALKISKVQNDKQLYGKSYESLIRGYPISFENNERELDFDEKLSDNRDFEVIWDFGTHEKDSEISKLVFGPERCQFYVHVMIAKELLISNDESLGSVDSLLRQLGEAKNSSEFSEMEKWELAVISCLITIIKENKSLEEFEEILNQRHKTSISLEDTLCNEFLVELFTLVTLARSLASIKVNYKSDINEKLNKLISVKSRQLMDTVRDSCSNVKAKHEQANRQHLVSTLDWFAGEGKVFDIDAEFVKDILGGIRESSNASISLLTNL